MFCDLGIGQIEEEAAEASVRFGLESGTEIPYIPGKGQSDVGSSEKNGQDQQRVRIFSILRLVHTRHNVT